MSKPTLFNLSKLGHKMYWTMYVQRKIGKFFSCFLPISLRVIYRPGGTFVKPQGHKSQLLHYRGNYSKLIGTLGGKIRDFGESPLKHTVCKINFFVILKSLGQYSVNCCLIFKVSFPFKTFIHYKILKTTGACPCCPTNSAGPD